VCVALAASGGAGDGSGGNHLRAQPRYDTPIVSCPHAMVADVESGRISGNERSDVVTPAFMEEVARASSDLPNMSVRVLQAEDLEKEGMNMFISVGQAATVPPRLVILEYRGNPDSEEKVALVGKGITFDTGGLNLKPTGFIEDMHTDMCGSAAVLGAVRAASRLGLKVNIVSALALAENAIGSKAVKPHTIVKSHKVSARGDCCSSLEGPIAH